MGEKQELGSLGASAPSCGSQADCESPGPFSQMVEREWQRLLDADDRNSPDEYPEMLLIERRELAGAMADAWFGGIDSARNSPWAVALTLSESERHELNCLRARIQQIAYPCSPHCDGYLRELALRNQQGLAREGEQSASEPPQINPQPES